MAETATPVLYLFRTGEFITSTSSGGTSAMGERGVLMAGNTPYHTVERRGGYVTLPIGEYEIKMEHSPTKKVNDQPRKQFRIYGHNVTNDRGQLAAFLIHLGNYPHQVQGCVAPGKSRLANGVDQSSKAMDEIFTFCGGFGVGKKAILVVDKIEL